MKFRNFLGVENTAQQAYFKDGVEMLYPSIGSVLKLAILPAYDPMDPKPTGWIPAVNGEEESDFYSVVRAAKFVGHGNRRAKTSFLSPKTFDLNADDPYDAFYDYCSHSDVWSYLTKDHRGNRLTGEIEGAAFPRMKNLFVANVMDVTAGSRGGVFVAELSESVMRSILYSTKKNGSRINGIAFQRDANGNLMFGDITDPGKALVMEVVYTAVRNGRAYIARPAIDDKGNLMRVEIPDTLLQHRQHMEEPSSFLVHPGSGQEIVDKLAGMLRGYKSEKGLDEIEALKEAMKFAYGDKYTVDEEAVEEPDKHDPFGEAAAKTVAAEPEKKAEAVQDSVERGVENEKYTPTDAPRQKPKKPKAKPLSADNPNAKPIVVEAAPGEDIDPADIASVRAMLSGGK